MWPVAKWFNYVCSIQLIYLNLKNFHKFWIKFFWNLRNVWVLLTLLNWVTRYCLVGYMNRCLYYRGSIVSSFTSIWAVRYYKSFQDMQFLRNTLLCVSLSIIAVTIAKVDDCLDQSDTFMTFQLPVSSFSWLNSVIFHWGFRSNHRSNEEVWCVSSSVYVNVSKASWITWITQDTQGYCHGIIKWINTIGRPIWKLFFNKLSTFTFAITYAYAL